MPGSSPAGRLRSLWTNRLSVIDTEKHFDHIGGNGYFRERGIDVYGDASLCRTEDEFRAEIAEFNEQIPNPARRARGEEETFYHGTNLGNPNRPIGEDTRMDLGDCEVDILLTPGHTPTNLSVWAPRDRVLFCGDCLTNGYLPNLDCGRESEWQQWLRSLERVARLRAQVVVPGHGPVAVGDEVDRLLGTVRGVLEQSIAEGYDVTTRVSAGPTSS